MGALCASKLVDSASASFFVILGKFFLLGIFWESSYSFMFRVHLVFNTALDRVRLGVSSRVFLPMLVSRFSMLGDLTLVD